jgi:hypothetical protein
VRKLIVSIAFLIVFSRCAALAAGTPAGQVRLDLVGVDQSAALAFQDWLQVLSKAGVKNVRMRAGDATEKVGIDVQGTEKSPLYVVTGLIANRNELLLPSGRYTRSDAVELAHWLDDLAKQGPPDRRPKKTVFALTVEQFGQINDDLSPTVGFTTKGAAQKEVVEKIGKKLKYPLTVSTLWQQAAGDGKIEDELSSISRGTALACILRSAGFCLVPRESEGKLSYSIIKDKPKLEAWPIGLEPSREKPSTKLVPALFELRNVNVENVSVTEVLDAISQRVDAPIFVDRNSLVGHDLDPAKILVSFPQRRSTYNEALKAMLFKAKMKFECRVDEAGSPFLWVTAIEPAG